ncbi:GGDEF domain-containing protein [Vibrio coralliilyticus]|uniref:GGDEF domain-containing protein n=1 Tax=Vibrio coralliilyticus TaxID=190893 RepID=UPI000BAAC8B9|nr:GGDEF domain-containing protein [Vibrio coralliilyticus]NOI58716.1 GGDEF domain-containing protein [Vibrio coralliilyticus]PAT68825.1 GGDEF domain-containing protein [Vibrio coralliilyticus]
MISELDLAIQLTKIIILLYISYLLLRHQVSNKILYGCLLAMISMIIELFINYCQLSWPAISSDHRDEVLLISSTTLLIAHILMLSGVSSLYFKLKEESEKDHLTQLNNRKFMRKIPEKDYDVIYLDIDNFKSINDTLGHDYGDALLVLFARYLSHCILKNEYLVRYGGDEFIAYVQPGRSGDFIERLLGYVANSEIEFSYGISGSAKGELFSAITRADKNMYLMKRRRSTSRGRKPAQVKET